MSTLKPVVAVFEDEKGSKYIKLNDNTAENTACVAATNQTSTQGDADEIIDLEHTDNESDGESEEYLATDEDEEVETTTEEDEDVPLPPIVEESDCLD